METAFSDVGPIKKCFVVKGIYYYRVEINNMRPQITQRILRTYFILGLNYNSNRFLTIPGRPGSKNTIGFVTFAMHVDATASLKRTDLKIGDNSLKLKLAPNTKLKDRKGGKKKEGEEGAVKDEEDVKDVVVGGLMEVGGKKEAEEKGKMRGNPRKARLIVRNLSFKSTEKNMRQTFKKVANKHS